MCPVINQYEHPYNLAWSDYTHCYVAGQTLTSNKLHSTTARIGPYHQDIYSAEEAHAEQEDHDPQDDEVQQLVDRGALELGLAGVLHELGVLPGEEHHTIAPGRVPQDCAPQQDLAEGGGGGGGGQGRRKRWRKSGERSGVMRE